MPRTPSRTAMPLRALALAGLFLSASCTPGDRDPGSVILRTEKGPFVRTWEGKCLELRAMVLTPEYRVAKDLERRRDTDDPVAASRWDSLIRSEKQPGNLQMRMRMAPGTDCPAPAGFLEGDIVMGRRSAPGEAGAKLFEQDYRMDRRLWLRLGDRKVAPSLVLAEQTPGLDQGRDLWIMFRLGQSDIENLDRSGKLVLALDLSLQGAGWAELSWPAKAYQERS